MFLVGRHYNTFLYCDLESYRPKFNIKIAMNRNLNPVQRIWYIQCQKGIQFPSISYRTSTQKSYRTPLRSPIRSTILPLSLILTKNISEFRMYLYSILTTIQWFNIKQVGTLNITQRGLLVKVPYNNLLYGERLPKGLLRTPINFVFFSRESCYNIICSMNYLNTLITEFIIHPSENVTVTIEYSFESDVLQKGTGTWDK